MITGRDIVCISSIDWEAHWQIHQQLASSLVQHGNRVLFIENTGVRTPGVQDLSRLRQRVANWWRSTKGFREVRPDLFVYSPVFVPLPYSSVARWVNRTLLFRGLKRWMAATAFRQPIVCTFLPTPLAHDLIAEIDPALVIYYCADDFASTSPGARRVRDSEDALFRGADLVFVTSERLRQRAAAFTTEAHPLPAGVDYAKFDAVRRAGDAVPADLAAIRRPVAGYVGALHVWVDQALLAAAARALPDVSFVLIGPRQVETPLLTGLANVHQLGARPHDQVPAYIKGFDVALVPYLRSEFTDSVYPVKLNEYLAMGVPVVATDLPEIRRFNERHGDVLTIAGDAGSFAAAIRSGLQTASEDRQARRVAVARENSWSQRLEEMSALIDAALVRRRERERGWEQRLRGLYRSARRRTVEVIAAVLIGYLLLFQTPLVWWLAEPLRLSETPVAADAVVVFAGGVGESGQAGGGYQERVKHAVDLYQAGYASRVVFSSGYVFAFREAEVMKALAVSLGVPAQDVILETEAANTRENVTFVTRIVREHGWSRVLLVSSPYHMRRAVLTWREAAPAVTVVPTPVPQSQFYAHGTGASLDQIRGILHEYLAILAYWWRGWI